MRKRRILLSIALVVMALLVVSTSVFAAADVLEDAVNDYFANLPSDNAMIGQEAFVEQVKAGEDLFVLDIRQPDVYNEGHIKGAVNIPWGPEAIPAALDMLPADKTIYVYCYTAQTANQTVALLNFAGFEAKSVKFGWNLGITRVDGYEEAVETEANELAGTTGYEINADIKTAIEDYYAGLADVSDTMYKNYKISEDMLKMAIDSDADMMVVSIRQSGAFAEGHIEGAVNIPWGAGMEQYFGQLPQDQKLVVYCYTGQTAGQAVAGLRMLGYDAVSLNGGMGTPANEPHGWTNKGYEVVQ
ncbi:rhodanese-related sulfurtransferase [Halanaerobium saccharolyticum]|uniref:Rhodanese-related sulfurtransferase n=1 Tax=Halanaerobium saccharolyticum TaxID=43595 RepID=A0A4R7YJJ7_9FIRM|nr:rhodanese-like domain-containing protein [Halanaerobium saccharolyticum]RAK04031.1 rhodanese-related sulfurtransferase [Halanaerobium saccharolyticum]TDV97590.1 rhodanese-related sulfurtransferase [Halanaerobium saccharolyticum]TDX49175.1 rhodanese-related sulfurtransferase [Halanaerobium saccharolyticum]